MRVTFFSNFLNHHQLPFCLEMQKKLGNNFKFVATEEIPEDRIKLGYDDMNKSYDFVVRAYEDKTEAYKLGAESDVVIIGSAPFEYIKQRLKEKKLTFRYSERVFKQGFKIRTWLGLIKNFTFREKNNVFLLCSSAYSAFDYNIAGVYINKCYKWGYFPEVKEYNIDELIEKKQKNKKTEIVWIGRFLKWKHPEKVIEIARKLRSDKYSFCIKMIGTGPMFDEIQELVNKYKLNDVVKLLGPINNKKVRSYMEKANIFLFTSDYNEGWGAVLNEAMNSGCAVIASHAIGSVPFLVDNNQNGLIYKDDSIVDLYDKVKCLVDCKKLQCKYGKAAYNTLVNVWNSKMACESFLKLSKNFLNGNFKEESEHGPCSKAKPIAQHKMYNYVMENKK